MLVFYISFVAKDCCSLLNVTQAQPAITIPLPPMSVITMNIDLLLILMLVFSVHVASLSVTLLQVTSFLAVKLSRANNACDLGL